MSIRGWEPNYFFSLQTANVLATTKIVKIHQYHRQFTLDNQLPEADKCFTDDIVSKVHQSNQIKSKPLFMCQIVLAEEKPSTNRGHLPKIIYNCAPSVQFVFIGVWLHSFFCSMTSGSIVKVFLHEQVVELCDESFYDRLHHVSKPLYYDVLMSFTSLTSVRYAFRQSTLIMSTRSLNTSPTVITDTPIQRPSCPPMSLIRFSNCKKENNKDKLLIGTSVKVHLQFAVTVYSDWIV